MFLFYKMKKLNYMISKALSALWVCFKDQELYQTVILLGHEHLIKCLFTVTLAEKVEY